MMSVENEKHEHEIEESNSDPVKVEGQVPDDISTSLRTVLDQEKSPRWLNKALTASSKQLSSLTFGSASARFKRLAEERDEVSRSVASSNNPGLRKRLSEFLMRKIDWDFLGKMCKEWIKNPMNMALFLWIAVVGVSGAILFLVMTGMLNRVIPKKSDRDIWFEVNNQILNALFTLMCLYNHPKRFYHLVLLCKWRPQDIFKLRKVYCKNETYKPHEWAHMLVVVVLLHVNCFAQYALCALNLGYTRSNRPTIGVAICISLAIGAPAIAGVYTIVSPLGRDYVLDMDEEAQLETATGEEKRLSGVPERKYSFASKDEERIVEHSPEWSGGLLDFWDDISLAYLSLFFSFCVFGWNMERLGFGNMYVHVATFLLFCVAPFWIFNLAAVNIDDESVREALAVTGVVLCVFGFLYGGFWRIQMRKRFNLPPYTFCCGEPAITDCALWLCCCWCSLAQEARTGNAYEIVEDTFCRKQIEGGENGGGGSGKGDGKTQIKSSSTSPQGGASSPCKSTSDSSSLYRNGDCSRDADMEHSIPEDSFTRGKNNFMTPPTPSLIEREAI